MPGCSVQYVEIKDGWSTRQKWNYVRSLYVPSYKIDTNGNRLECYTWEDNCIARSVTDPARVYDENKYDQMYSTDYDAWQAHAPSAHFEKFLEWKYKYGTYIYGNLPQYKKSHHVGHKWMICPYSTQSSEDRTKFILGIDDLDALPLQNDHGTYYMKTASNGASWGFECTYANCPYFTTINVGKKFFYR